MRYLMIPFVIARIVTYYVFKKYNYVCGTHINDLVSNVRVMFKELMPGKYNGSESWLQYNTGQR
jgi:hypothetical protein